MNSSDDFFLLKRRFWLLSESTLPFIILKNRVLDCHWHRPSQRLPHYSPKCHPFDGVHIWIWLHREILRFFLQTGINWTELNAMWRSIKRRSFSSLFIDQLASFVIQLTSWLTHEPTFNRETHLKLIEPFISQRWTTKKLWHFRWTIEKNKEKRISFQRDLRQYTQAQAIATVQHNCSNSSQPIDNLFFCL